MNARKIDGALPQSNGSAVGGTSLPLTPAIAMGRRITAARLEAGYTQRELAMAVGITKLRLTRLESGEGGAIGSTLLTALSIALRVTERWLREGDATDLAFQPSGTELLHGVGARTRDALQPGLALLRGLRRQYVMGRLTHAQLLTLCGLAHQFAISTPRADSSIHFSEQSVASRLRSRRIFLGISIEVLAERTGIPGEQLVQMEQGVAVDTESLRLLADALDVDMNWLLLGTTLQVATASASELHVSP